MSFSRGQQVQVVIPEVSNDPEYAELLVRAKQHVNSLKMQGIIVEIEDNEYGVYIDGGVQWFAADELVLVP
jgi:hypothetical protein